MFHDFAPPNKEKGGIGSERLELLFPIDLSEEIGPHVFKERPKDTKDSEIPTLEFGVPRRLLQSKAGGHCTPKL